MSTSEVLTLAIAGYAAILSTILAVLQLRRERRSLKLRCRIAIAALTGGETAQFLSIEAVNVGHRPIEVHMAGLLMNNREVFLQVASRLARNPLPVKLADGESVSINYDLDKARLAIRDSGIPGLRYTHAIVRDAEDREYRCRVPNGIHLVTRKLGAA